jgi:hypothetical protein
MDDRSGDPIIMTLYEKIIAEYPELEGSKSFIDGTIILQNEGQGDYVAAWNYSKPLPDGLSVGR